VGQLASDIFDIFPNARGFMKQSVTHDDQVLETEFGA
jgi:hypothetical protein